MSGSPLDPEDVNGRLYSAMSMMLDDFDDLDVRERVAVISAIARIQVLMMKIREEPGAVASSGSKVREYEEAFKANATRSTKRIKRRTTDIVAALDAIEQFEDNERLATGELDR